MKENKFIGIDENGAPYLKDRWLDFNFTLDEYRAGTADLSETDLREIFATMYPLVAAEGYKLSTDGDVVHFVQQIDEQPEITYPEPEQPAPHIMTIEEIEAAAKVDRQTRIDAIMWRVQRYQTQQDLGVQTTDSGEKYQDILQYLQDLRDVPGQAGFPNAIEWPVEPD